MRIVKRTGIAPARIFPPDACKLLSDAASSEPIDRRVFAVDTAIDKVKLMYPCFFKQDHAGEYPHEE